MLSAMNIRNLSNTQKLALSGFASLILILLFIHNPLSGYVIEQINPLYEQGVHKVPCTPSEKAAYREEMMSLEGGWTKLRGEPWTEEGRKIEAAYIESSVAECTKSVPYKITAPFSQWKSNEPLINWFGSAAIIIQLIVILGIIFSIIFFLFKKEEHV